MRVGAEQEPGIAALEPCRRQVRVEHIEGREVERVVRGDQRREKGRQRDEAEDEAGDRRARALGGEGDERARAGARAAAIIACPRG